MKVKAKKINNPNCDCLTEGKVYETFDYGPVGFKTRDNFGNVRYCRYRDCLHTGGNWTIITDKAKVR